jgi:hypothetical protein
LPTVIGTLASTRTARDTDKESLIISTETKKVELMSMTKSTANTYTPTQMAELKEETI